MGTRAPRTYLQLMAWIRRGLADRSECTVRCGTSDIASIGQNRCEGVSSTVSSATPHRNRESRA
jgi:hypothetical protein